MTVPKQHTASGVFYYKNPIKSNSINWGLGANVLKPNQTKPFFTWKSIFKKKQTNGKDHFTSKGELIKSNVKVESVGLRKANNKRKMRESFAFMCIEGEDNRTSENNRWISEIGWIQTWLIKADTDLFVFLPNKPKPQLIIHLTQVHCFTGVRVYSNEIFLMIFATNTNWLWNYCTHKSQCQTDKMIKSLFVVYSWHFKLIVWKLLNFSKQKTNQWRWTK